MGIQLKLILIAYFVNFEWTLVQLHSPIVKQAVTSNVDDADGIRENHLLNFTAKNDVKKSEAYQEILNEEATKGQQIFNKMREELLTARYRNENKKRSLYKESNAGKDILVVKREMNEQNKPNSNHSNDVSIDAEDSADLDPEDRNSNESVPFWERIYIFRSSNDNKRGPPKPAEQMNVSRDGFLETLIHVEELSKRVNDAVETYKICYRKYGHDLDESMYYVDQFNTHLNDTYDTIRSLLLGQPDQITQSNLNVAMSGVDTELRRQAFDELSQNYQLSEPCLHCGIELDVLREELQGTSEYASAECNSDAGKKARLEMLRKARIFRKEERIRQKTNETEGNTNY